MVWLNPVALFALAAVAAPILIHILIQRRAERFAFPTLRFLQPTRLAAIRRHMLEDPWLLAVRMALLAAAAAALAGPLVVTASRRQAWDRRVVRAVVVDDTDDAIAVARAFQAGDRGPERAALQQRFTTFALPDGLRRAILWLDGAPPARREIVVSSALAIGSLTDADISSVPAGIGVRFERTGTLPITRTVPAGRLLTTGGARAREVTLTGVQTSVREAGEREPMAWPIDVVSSNAQKPAIDAAIAAVLSQHLWAGPPEHRARLVVVDAISPTIADASPIHQPWMADAVSRMARDPDLQAAAARVAAGLTDTRWGAAPWQTLTAAADGRPLAVAAGSATQLVVASGAPASDLATPVLLRSMANAVGLVPDLRRAEVVPIADAVLQRWSRPSTPPAPPRFDTVDRDDRRWLWLAVLCLMVLEMWVRRASAPAVSGFSTDEASAKPVSLSADAGEEGSRVA